MLTNNNNKKTQLHQHQHSIDPMAYYMQYLRFARFEIKEEEKKMSQFHQHLILVLLDVKYIALQRNIIIYACCAWIYIGSFVFLLFVFCCVVICA